MKQRFIKAIIVLWLIVCVLVACSASFALGVNFHKIKTQDQQFDDVYSSIMYDSLDANGFIDEEHFKKLVEISLVPVNK